MAETSPESPATSSDNFSLFVVWRRNPDQPVRETDETELENIVTFLAERGVTVRGFYDVSGLRADADLMVWLHGPVAEDLQRAVRRLRRTELLRPLLPTWNAMSVHRDAEFNKSHVPGYLRGIAPKGWLTVYPFVRSHEWYLLPDDERRAMLADHGRKGAAFKGVTANTMAAFALGDYEWMLPMEADELTDLVDMMRDLRYTDARRHVREETPFYTGRRIPIAEIPETLQ
ncbi:hydrogen peroxide-dependent heme synthase [Microbacterium sp. JB110]|uniref:hydrogen peroxide-dependent heme synthase n=1 Tax=Microbacterium sp. JB110 TaxID=2024477 RepID=UPI00097F5DB3|nr:hydrogen peroxide-dependent heme synthase [Microbacterium sp. JB110]RCS57302.1 chlorite dismutase [Microbacterium sp. JB110]SJM58402.1 Hemoprotein HemQ, essential component of heme biosynthetic pathway in Gram-positive bacteria [Frigoribacterium sp. JB110]